MGDRDEDEDYRVGKRGRDEVEGCWERVEREDGVFRISGRVVKSKKGESGE